MEIRQTEVDGVPTFWAEGDAADSYHAVLTFRVGRADETLARNGITHLVEHLALHGIGQPEHHYNGAVDTVTTMFFTQGDAAAITKFFANVCGALRDLPLHRLEAEKQILRTEAESRGGGPATALLLWRYGSAGHGLPGYNDLALGAHGPDDVARWARTWFTRGNAALGITGGRPPEDLRLELPDGPRAPVPEPIPILPHLPAYFHDEINGVAVSSVVERSSAAAVFAAMLQRRLRQALRMDQAVSYTTSVGYVPVSGELAHINGYADGLDAAHPKLVAQFDAEIGRAAAEPAAAEEVAEVIASLRAGWESKDAAGGLVITSCWNELMGLPFRPFAERVADLLAVTPEQIRQVGQAVRDSALLMLPYGQEPPTGRYAPAPPSSVTAVDGWILRRVDPDEDELHLVVGGDGVTLMRGPQLATIYYESCVAMLAWPDGARRLIGYDGINVSVEPTLWENAGDLTAELDRRVPPDRFVPMPERSADRVPRPAQVRPADGGPAPVRIVRSDREPPLRRLLPRQTTGYRVNTAWDDPALAAALPGLRTGPPSQAAELLARARGQHELRILRSDLLGDAFVGRGAELTQLAARHPDSPELQLLLGSTRIKEAWEVRSSFRAEHVTEEQFNQFWLLLSSACAPLRRATGLLPDDPAPWDHLMWFAIGMQLGRVELDRIWSELARRGPSCFASHYSRAQAVCGKWWGSDAEVLDFAETTAASARPGDPLSALVAVAHLEIATDCADGMEAYFAQPGVHASLTAAQERWLAGPQPHPRTAEAHHLFGGAFYYAGDRHRAKFHLSNAGRTVPRALPWGYVHDNPVRAYKDARADLGL